MTCTISAEKRRTLLHDMLNSQRDLVALAQAQQINPAALAAWMADPATRRTLANLCTLADFQTQMLLARYRSVVAGELIRIATNAPSRGGGGTELTRRACVDVLRLELPRTKLEAEEELMDEAGRVPERAELYGGGAAANEGPHAMPHEEPRTTEP